MAKPIATPQQPIIVTPKQAFNNSSDLEQQALAGLPPPGDERNEVLAARNDMLQQQVEQLNSEIDATAIDPSKIKPEREIQYQIVQGQMEIPNAVDGMVYCWVYTGRDGSQVNAKQSELVGTTRGKVHVGWQIVDNSMPEAKSMPVDVNGHVRIGDTVLMRRTREKHELHNEYMEYVKRVRTHGVEADLRDMDERNRRGGKGVYLKEGLVNPLGGNRQEAKAHYGQALQHVDKLLREGKVPGMEIGGGGR